MNYRSFLVPFVDGRLSKINMPPPIRRLILASWFESVKEEANEVINARFFLIKEERKKMEGRQDNRERDINTNKERYKKRKKKERQTHKKIRKMK